MSGESTADSRSLASARGWRRGLVLAAILAPLACGFVIPIYRDAAVTHFPAKLETRRQLLAGEIPFVLPAASGGQPLLGNPNFATFFPDLLAFCLLPSRAAFGLHFALAFALGLIGARRWSRAEGSSRVVADIAALLFAASGPFLSAWTFYNSGLALGLVPWMLAATAKLARRPDRRRCAELGLWTGLELLAGEPVIALLGFLLVALRTLASDQRRRALPLAAAGLALGVGVAAVQIGTAYQAMRGSSRALAPFSFGASTAASVRPEHGLDVLAPFPFGRPDRIGVDGFAGHASFDDHEPYLWSLHLGWLTLLLGIGVAWRRGPAMRWAATGVAGAAIVLAFGRHLPGAGWGFPLLSIGGRLRYPVKWWYVVGLMIVPFASTTIASWLEPSAGRRKGWALVAVFLAAGAAIVVAPPNPWSWAALALAASGAALSRLQTFPRPTSALALAAGAGFVAHVPLIALLLGQPGELPTVLPPTRLVDRAHIVQHPPASTASESIDSVQTRAYTELWALTGSAIGHRYLFDLDPDGSYNFHDRIMREAFDQAPWSERWNSLRLAGVSYVVADEELGPPFIPAARLSTTARLWQVPGPLPEIRFAGVIVESPHFNATVAIHRSQAFDPVTTTVLPGKRGISGAPASATIRIRKDGPSRLEFDVAAAAPGAVVVARSYHPAYLAKVDGVAARVLAADGHLIGVRLPAGDHTVSIAWDRRPLLAGALLSILSAIALGWVRGCRIRSPS